MSYLEEFQKKILSRDLPKLLQLWEEYCLNDVADIDELKDLLPLLKNSEYSRQFGQLVENALPLWKTIQDKEDSYTVLRLLIDLQNTNSPTLADLALNAIKEKYPNDPEASERLRLVGLRTRDNFQGALSAYDLLAHMQVGKFVYHSGGWGAGEILEMSQLRQQITVEFEHIPGRKYFNFSNAFKALTPLPDTHFLSRRFASPDDLEKEAKEDPVKVITMLLQDLGPKTASEIKDEMCELVIPEADWTKWWQNARAKIKKTTTIENPATTKDLFKLRKSATSHEALLTEALHKIENVDDTIQTSYNYVRDLPKILKDEEVKESIKNRILSLLDNKDLTPEQLFQIAIFLEQSFDYKIPGKSVEELTKSLPNLEAVINNFHIIAFKKQALISIRQFREDWLELFFALLFSIQPSALRDYILTELNQPATRDLLEKKINHLLIHPSISPETFIWYFNKVVSSQNENIPYADKAGQCQFFEAILILLNSIENRPEYKELAKKIYNIISGKRYAIVRAIMEGSSLEFIKEVLLLASKCQTFEDHDIKILKSLAEVVHPSLNTTKARKGATNVDGNIIWTTEAGYQKTKERIRQIATVETVENAREIEAARALGDLSENSEYKFALEMRSRLQGELKSLSDLMNRARIITKEDIHSDEVGVGSIVEVEDTKNQRTTYTILGPWDAAPEDYILSFQSKLAQAMVGCKVGDEFEFRQDKYRVISIKSFFDQVPASYTEEH